MTLALSWSAQEAATRAIAAAKDGAKVLIIRNTVDAAVETFKVVREAGGTGLLWHVEGRPTLHHARFATEDRALLDRAVEKTLTVKKEKRSTDGVIVIGTQTLEQSLDIDADLLITDLCPVDVLLQRIGRLHRHDLPRPTGFEQSQCVVLSPAEGLDHLAAPKFCNGLGGWLDSTGVLQGVYRNLHACELTRRLIVAHPEWRIGVSWKGRNYDRNNPNAGDSPNQAINHAASAMRAAASVAVASVGAIPQLGFVHEDSGQSFVLDIADLYRHDATLDIAFGAAKEAEKSGDPVERLARRRAAKLFRKRALIPSMIDHIKTLIGPEGTAEPASGEP